MSLDDQRRRMKSLTRIGTPTEPPVVLDRVLVFGRCHLERVLAER